MFLDDSACNLASINLMKFRRQDRNFDLERFQAACRIFIVAQDILVDRASYPTAKIAENSHRFRPLGLGYANLGGLLMSIGLPYDSEGACGWCGCITAVMHAAANLTSIELARNVGRFEGYQQNSKPMNRVMEMHRDAVAAIKNGAPEDLRRAAVRLWDQVVAEGQKHGFRNAQVTVLAPTGTIGFMMDCTTTGIEPDIALVKYKQLAGGGMLKIVNQTVPLALDALGYDEPKIESIIAYIDERNTIEGAPELDENHLPVFDCAFKPNNGTRSISWRAHIRMMAAAQPFLSGAISKTVNMPNQATPNEIADAFMWGWRMGLKALAIYRDGSKQSQPLSTTKEDFDAPGTAVAKPRRERLPNTRQSITHKFNIGGHEGYITIGLYPDNRPGELFIIMAKEGSTVGGLMDCFGTAISICLQYGVPLDVLVNKFSHTRFEPMGFTSDPDIRIAKSLVDYIFRWLEKTFLRKAAEPMDGLDVLNDGMGHANGNENSTPSSRLAVQSAPPATHDHGRNEQFARFQSDAPSCDNCGAITVRNGNCYLCYNCGNSMGCS
jgi:ribonucleoside-diphosphate reductase alpha chain